MTSSSTHAFAVSNNPMSRPFNEQFESGRFPEFPPTPADGSGSDPVDHLVGRESELSLLKIVLLRPDVRILTLTGPAGIGKTRIVLSLAARVSSSFAGGVVAVDH